MNGRGTGTLGLRIGQISAVVMFAFVEASILFVNGRGPRPGPNLAFYTYLGCGIFAVGLFEVVIRLRSRKVARVRAAVESVAQTLFDAPAAVTPGYNLAATISASTEDSRQAISSLVIDFGAGFTTEGTSRGVRVSAASHVSTVGRGFGELSHIFSHVLVDLGGTVLPFRILERGVGSSIATAVDLVRDVGTGDPAFDGAFIIDTDPALAREVLAPAGIRGRLVELRSKVGQVGWDFGTQRMNVVLTSYGLAVRWPGELDARFAAVLRDLLLDLRASLVAYLQRRPGGPTVARLA
jgi:hypothetical protein